MSADDNVVNNDTDQAFESISVKPHTSGTFLLAILAIIPGLVLGFFAYRLYKSLRDKERAKAEKKRVKQERKEKDPKVKQKKK